MRPTIIVAATLAASVALGLAAPVHAQSRNQSSAGDFISKWDPDKDRTLDLAEVKKAASARFKQLDRDNDGTLDKNEAAKAGIGKGEFAKLDPDKDGTLDRNEYLAVVERRFKAANPDNDGSIDEAELSTPAGQALHRLLGPANARTASRSGGAGQSGASTR